MNYQRKKNRSEDESVSDEVNTDELREKEN